MIARCTRPRSHKYRLYGARGIVVCERWLTFANFYADMGPRPSPRHSIDRIDNDGPYAPENCRWALPMEQSRNRRGNRLVTIGGEARLFIEWATTLRIPIGTLHYRLRRWPSEEP